MRFSTLFQIGAIAALGVPVLAQQPATNGVAALDARGLEEPMILEARRDPGQNSVPKKPKKKPAPAPRPAAPPARGAGRAAVLRNTYPGFGQRKRSVAEAEEASVLEARRDPGQNSVPKKPKKKPAPAPRPAAPPARGAGRAAALRNTYPGFGQRKRSVAEAEQASVLEARRDPGQNSVPKKPKKKPAPAPRPAAPPARGAGRAAALRNTYPGFGQRKRSVAEAEQASVLEARRDPGQNSVPKKPKKKPAPAPRPAAPPARGAGRAAALRNTYPGFGQ